MNESYSDRKKMLVQTASSDKPRGHMPKGAVSDDYASAALDLPGWSSVSNYVAVAPTQAAHTAATATAEANAVANTVAVADIAAAAGPRAHAAVVAVARNVFLPDTAADAFYSASVAYFSRPPDVYSVAQNEKLCALIDEHLSRATSC